MARKDMTACRKMCRADPWFRLFSLEKSPKAYDPIGDNNVTCGPDCAQMPEGDYGRIMKINLDAKTTVTAHYGLRSPYRFSFDPMTGDFYIGDVGESGAGVEKHFYIKAGTAKKNMGWGGGTRPPALDSGDAATPAIGGFVYRGKAIPDLCGFYLYGQYNGGPIRRSRWDRPAR
jgi:hypothetical protein